MRTALSTQIERWTLHVDYLVNILDSLQGLPRPNGMCVVGLQCSTQKNPTLQHSLTPNADRSIDTDRKMDHACRQFGEHFAFTQRLTKRSPQGMCVP